jgi:NAD(P)-dependent dehydrogenase (short-subunit alcohol dehydrogenase family)
MDRFDFSGKTAVIIGGSRGIGLETARAFAASGARVVITGRTPEHVREAVAALGGQSERVRASTFDATREGPVSEFYEGLKRELGAIDFLVNSLGWAKAGRIEEFSLEEWERIFAVNVTSVFLSVKHALPLLRKSRTPKIVNLSSIAGRFRSLLSGTPYSASKGAVITLTRQLGAELGPEGFNVNVVCPGPTQTDMLVPFAEKTDAMKGNIPLGRVATASDQANVILFLCSELSRHINGAAIDVNGGQY